LLNAGSDILCMALRVARTATGRTLLVKFAGSYHGWYDDFLFNVSSYDGPPANAGEYRPLAEPAGLPASAEQNNRVLDYNDSEAVKTLFAAEGDRIAAVVVEPVMHGPTTGSIDPLPGFRETLRSLCDAHGAVLIFDEIYPAQVRTRKSLGEMMRKLSVT